MRITVIALVLLAVTACNRQQPNDTTAPAATATEATAAGAVEKPKSAFERQDLETPLPEGFELPFAYHRVADNLGKTADGKPQRRILVEILEGDAAAAQQGIVNALVAKGFGQPVIEPVAGINQLTFSRADGVTVIVKVDPQPKRVRAPNATGTVHMTWNMI
jgi:hypothetical protein